MLEFYVSKTFHCQKKAHGSINVTNFIWLLTSLVCPVIFFGGLFYPHKGLKNPPPSKEIFAWKKKVLSDNFEKVKLFFSMFLSIKRVWLMFFFLFSTSFLRLTAKKNLHVVDKYGPQKRCWKWWELWGENNGILRVNLHYTKHNTCKNLKSQAAFASWLPALL